MKDQPNGFTRRDFVQTSTLAAASIIIPRPAEAAARRYRTAETIKVGVIGCGGRGSGAVRDCLRADPDTVLVAMGDLFPDRLQRSRTNLERVASENADFAKQYQVTPEMTFSGFDAYQKVLATDIDLVILATPPGFRPVHLAAAVAAGKHIFTEKPVAVDATGVRSVIASAEQARMKGLAMVAGTQRRHDLGYNEVMKRVHDRAIGDILSGQVFWNQGGLWKADREAAWSDTEWQIRNWLYFAWLSGDHIVEQHIHNIDVANWAIGGHPVKAIGLGGRQSRTSPEYGHIFDHFAIDFEYANGARVTSMCRQIEGCANLVGENFIGTRGSTNGATEITGDNAYKFTGESRNPYVLEHVDLLKSIRDGKVLNEGRQVAESTLSAIMGREAAYTGQTIEWDALLNSTQSIAPPDVAFGSLPVPPVPMPGVTKVDRMWENG